MKTAVVILNWNGKALLEKFLPSVVAYSDGAEIYVADNASTDDSVAFLTAQYPAIKIIQNSGNLGFAQGYNEALQHLDADIYALVNSDIEVTPNWLQPIVATFQNEPQTAIIQPKILDYKDKSYFEYAGAAGGFIDQYGYPFCRGRIFETLEKDQQQYNDDCKIFWASGACFFVRSSVYHSLNGFDADFFAHQEEIDLCWRAFNQGHHTKYVAQSTVYHVGGATLEKSNPKKTYLNFRNSLMMLVKNLPSGELFHIIFIRLIMDGIAGIQFLFKGKPTHTLAVIKAHFSFYAGFSKNYKKRSGQQFENYYKTKSIIYRYFISNIKIYKGNF